MIRATETRRKGDWTGPEADRITLDFDDRRRRRIAMTGDGGLAFLLDLARPAELKDGDALVLEDGRVVAVRAASEPLIEIVAADPADLVRIAWHLGNRHLPTQLLRDRLRIREDHVIADMVERLGAEIAHIEAPFEPEGGAYSGHGHAHGHTHGHRPGHSHSADHDQSAAPANGRAP